MAQCTSSLNVFALASIGNLTSICTEPLLLCLSCILLVRIGSTSFSLMISIAYFILVLFFFFTHLATWLDPALFFHLLIFPSLFILFQLLLIKKKKKTCASRTFSHPLSNSLPCTHPIINSPNTSILVFLCRSLFHSSIRIL